MGRLVEVCKTYRGVQKVVGTGTFHQFGLDYNEYEEGPGTFSVAIVEMPDGTIENVPVDHIRFIEPTPVEPSAVGSKNSEEILWGSPPIEPGRDRSTTTYA